jgi:hypothetical protein
MRHHSSMLSAARVPRGYRAGWLRRNNLVPQRRLPHTMHQHQLILGGC